MPNKPAREGGNRGKGALARKRCAYLAVANDSPHSLATCCSGQIETHCEQLKIALAAGIVARGPGRVIDRHTPRHRSNNFRQLMGATIWYAACVAHTQGERETETETQIQAQTAGNDLVTKLERV